MATSDPMMSTKRLTRRCHGRSSARPIAMSGSPPSVRTRPSKSRTSKNRGTTSIATPAASQRRRRGRISESLRRVNETTTRSMRCSTRTRSRSSIRPITGGASSPKRRRIVVEAPDHLRRTLHAAAREADEAAGHDPGAQHQHALTLVRGPCRAGTPRGADDCRGLRRSSSRLDVRLELRRQEEPSARHSGPGVDPPIFAKFAETTRAYCSPLRRPPRTAESHLNWLASRAVRVDPRPPAGALRPPGSPRCGRGRPASPVTSSISPASTLLACTSRPTKVPLPMPAPSMTVALPPGLLLAATHDHAWAGRRHEPGAPYGLMAARDQDHDGGKGARRHYGGHEPRDGAPCIAHTAPWPRRHGARASRRTHEGGADLVGHAGQIPRQYAQPLDRLPQ